MLEAGEVVPDPGCQDDHGRRPRHEQPLQFLADVDRARDPYEGHDDERNEQEQLGARERGEAARHPHRGDQPQARPVPVPERQQQDDGDEQDRQRLGLQHAVV